jgi:hypothetical protein
MERRAEGKRRKVEENSLVVGLGRGRGGYNIFFSEGQWGPGLGDE